MCFMMKFSFFKQLTISLKNLFKRQEWRKEDRSVLFILKSFLLNLVCAGLDYNKNVIQFCGGYRT